MAYRKDDETMDEFQKLENPQLVELDGEYGFVIVTEIDMSLIKSGVIVMRGKSYNYESGEIIKSNDKEIQYSIHENAYYNLDDNGKVID
ncbi:hypothetical protein H1D32_13255 [Anaerobacillus sp. CMMVII]|uniref:hypothetical protein n=1 Tax=Anaerobacillus sp. CMMVII TaxID=2755588 RepID=UPI0021B6F436|nr:hypothetical protein [Anaerobacillus sp. CMMVII]MCT8138623.1 hypothetical protein [Anaerobacillus sp. CMMVII]